MLKWGRFSDPRLHHDGWFRVFAGKRFIEVWFGHTWIMFTI